MREEFINLINKQFFPKVDLKIDVGTCSFRLLSNTDCFVASKYFSSHSKKEYADESVDFQLFCVSLKKSGIKKEEIQNYIDKSCRSGQFSDGYYVTDHFGDPVYLISEGTSFYLFGENLEKLVWPYFVKYFLLRHAIKNESLFLKAAAFSLGSKATLLLGRGGSGKTVFLSGMCLNGANFISNSHVIVKERKVYGVASAMRIRPKSWCKGLFDKNKVHTGIKQGEIIVDPFDIFKQNIHPGVEVNNICILNFEKEQVHKIKEIPHEVALSYAEQFSLGINVYRLEEDLLDLYKDDIAVFSEKYVLMKKLLDDLIKNCKCYYVSTDILNTKNRDEIISLLS